MKENVEIQAYRIAGFCAAFSVSRSQVYRDIAGGRLEIVKRGRMTLITKQAAQDWLNASAPQALPSQPLPEKPD